MGNIVLDSLGIFSSHCCLGKLLNLENSKQDPHGCLSFCISQLKAVMSVLPLDKLFQCLLFFIKNAIHYALLSSCCAPLAGFLGLLCLFTVGTATGFLHCWLPEWRLVLNSIISLFRVPGPELGSLLLSVLSKYFRRTTTISRLFFIIKLINPWP